MLGQTGVSNEAGPLDVIELQYVLGYGFESGAIAYAGKAFSHLDTVITDKHSWRFGCGAGCLIGARSDRIRDIDPGVQIRPPFYDDRTGSPIGSGWKRRTVVQIEGPAHKVRAYYDFIYDQRGKPYDSRAILDFITGSLRTRDWRDPSAWFCDELVCSGLEVSKFVQRLHLIPSNRVNPGGSFLLISGIPTMKVIYDHIN
jgi:hypothetical protein